MTPGTYLEIVGDPVASFEFTGLPSVNTHYGLHWRVRSVRTSELRYEAKYKANEVMGWDNGPLIKGRALVVVNVYPPYEEVSDIHNVTIKPLLDGFTDAGIWADDEWAWLPIVIYRWAGIGDYKPRQVKLRRTVIDVYELGSVIINGMSQILPKGRKKNDSIKQGQSKPRRKKTASRKKG